MRIFLLTASYLVGAGELILAIYFWATNSKSEIRRVMALLSFITALWVLLGAGTSFVAESNLVTIELRFVYVLGIFLLTCLLHLSIVFPIKTFRFDSFHAVLLYIPAFVLGLFTLASDTIIKWWNVTPNTEGTSDYGSLFVFYNIYLLLLYVLTIALLNHKISATQGVLKRNAKLVFWSILLGGLPGVVVDLIFTILRINASGFYGTLSTVIWLGFTGYIIMRKE